MFKDLAENRIKVMVGGVSFFQLWAGKVSCIPGSHNPATLVTGDRHYVTYDT